MLNNVRYENTTSMRYVTDEKYRVLIRFSQARLKLLTIVYPDKYEYI